MTWKLCFSWLAMMVWVFLVMRNLFGDLWLVAAASVSGSGSTR
jgi:hypothetical protein